MTLQQRNEDEQVARRLQPAANRIYGEVFPGATRSPVATALREALTARGLNAEKISSFALLLDQEMGIDAIITMPDGSNMTVQEKFRRNVRYRDFTQEFRNAVGTENESPGEWFKLYPQLYMYGWESNRQGEFEAWALINVVAYKQLVTASGGLAKIGQHRQNRRHGSADFYAIPISALKSAFIASHNVLP